MDKALDWQSKGREVKTQRRKVVVKWLKREEELVMVRRKCRGNSCVYSLVEKLNIF